MISQRALTVLSGKPEGFGGDLRFGKPDGLSGADELCRRAAEMGRPGAGSKTWRALLSVASGPGGMPVHARDRVGQGPWYDRNGRLLAMTLEGLFGGDRPMGDAQLVNDMTNERGEPNHRVGVNGYNPSQLVDNHDTLTGSNAQGRLQAGATCNDWTGASGRPPDDRALLAPQRHQWPPLGLRSLGARLRAGRGSHAGRLGQRWLRRLQRRLRRLLLLRRSLRRPASARGPAATRGPRAARRPTAAQSKMSRRQMPRITRAGSATRPPPGGSLDLRDPGSSRGA